MCVTGEGRSVTERPSPVTGVVTPSTAISDTVNGWRLKSFKVDGVETGVRKLLMEVHEVQMVFDTVSICIHVVPTRVNVTPQQIPSMYNSSFS